MFTSVANDEKADATWVKCGFAYKLLLAQQIPHNDFLPTFSVNYIYLDMTHTNIYVNC